MKQSEALVITDTQLLSLATELYGLEGYEIKPVEAHDGGRNVVYTCEKDGDNTKILRFAYLNDRGWEDILGEVEYVR